MRETINIEVRKRFRMSAQGYRRLGEYKRLVYVPLIIKHIWNGVLRVEQIEDEETLAGWLFQRFRESAEYFIFKLKDSGKKTDKGFKYLCRVRITKITANKFSYEYLNIKGISRYSFWLKEY